MLPKSDRCILCLKYFNESIKEDRKTVEHVFPKAWYPENTPANLEKWKIPSCQRCNNDYSFYEQELLVRLAFGLSDFDENVSGIIQKAKRSIKPEFAKNERDRQKRLMLKKRLIKDLSYTDQIPQRAIIPNFGPRSNIKGKQPIISIKAKYFELFTKKIVKGLTFLWDHHLIESDYTIKYHLLNDIDSEPFIKRINKLGETYHRGAGIVVKRAVAYDDKKSSIYHIEIWGRLKIFGSVTKIKENQNIAP